MTDILRHLAHAETVSGRAAVTVVELPLLLSLHIAVLLLGSLLLVVFA